jgi:Fic family protein
MNLGEARSKCDHISGIPLRPSTAEKLHILYLAKGVLATTAIEGNTLTEDEVREHLKGKLKLPASKEYLQQEIENIIQACQEICNGVVAGKDTPLNLNLIKEFNQKVLDKLTVNEGVWPGHIRTHPVGVGGYLGAPAGECEYLLHKLCEWLSSDAFTPTEGNEIPFALIKAALAHIYIAWIHPFGDGNGRTARLIEFKILLEAGVPYPASQLLSNHYNQTRQVYYRQLDEASKSGGNILPFLNYAAQGFVDQLREQLGVIRSQQWDVTWRNYVFEKYRDNKGTSAHRQRRLVLDLSDTDTPTPVNKLSEISPQVAKLYAKKTIRTVQRDVNAIEALGLIEKSEKGVRAKREEILAFLPIKRRPKASPQLALL